MKILKTFILTFLLVVSLVGCNSESDNSESDTYTYHTTLVVYYPTATDTLNFTTEKPTRLFVHNTRTSLKEKNITLYNTISPAKILRQTKTRN